MFGMRERERGAVGVKWEEFIWWKLLSEIILFSSINEYCDKCRTPSQPFI
jgi:hypothetical protein